MEQRWQLQNAKNKLSEVIEQACTSGPQVITSRGRDKAVIVSFEAYRKLTAPEGNLLEFFRDSPLVGAQLDLERSHDLGRDIAL